MNFSELEGEYELTPDDARCIFEASICAMLQTVGENETLEELAAAWNGIAMAAEDPTEAVKIAMEIAGIEKTTIQ
jgi:hypothetical protein